MRLANVQPGDTIEAEVRGHEFRAKVIDLNCDEIPWLPIRVEPLSRNISHRHLRASQIVARVDPPPRSRRKAAA